MTPFQGLQIDAGFLHSEHVAHLEFYELLANLATELHVPRDI